MSYGLTPSGLARGNSYMAQPMVRCNINGALRYHEFVISRIVGLVASGTGGFAALRLVLNGPRQAVGLHLGPDLRHIMPEHDDIVFFAVDIPDMIAQQGFGLEA